MKSGHEYNLTSQQQSFVLSLTENMSEVLCFEYEGYVFEGERIEVAKRYVALNPSDSFWVWLHKNCRILFAPASEEEYVKTKRKK